MIRSRLLGLIGSIVSLTFIFDIGNISRVAISNIVGNNLSTAIGKSYTIFSIGSITITGFILSKVGTRVVISNSISISVDSWAIISRLRVSRVNRSWVNNGSMVDRGMVNRDVVDRGMVDRSSMEDGSMVDSMMNRGMVNSMVSRCMMNSMVERCGMEDRSMVSIKVTMGRGRGDQGVMHRIRMTNIGSGQSQES